MNKEMNIRRKSVGKLKATFKGTKIQNIKTGFYRNIVLLN